MNADPVLERLDELIRAQREAGFGDRYLTAEGVAILLGYSHTYVRDEVVHKAYFPGALRIEAGGHPRWLMSSVLQWDTAQKRWNAPAPKLPNRSRHVLYNTWKKMHHRCGNPNADQYRWYGERGISVCERWNSFERFVADMGPRPSRRHSIDRRDNYRGYEPDNCRWATPAEQYANRRCPRCDEGTCS